MSATLTFLAGLLALILFFWYFATDYALRRRILGTVLTLLILTICVESFWPEKVEVTDKGGQVVPEIKTATNTPELLKPREFKYKPKINLGLDLQGGTSFLIQLKQPEELKDAPRLVTKQMLDQAVEVIRKRVDKYGVSEPVITPEGQDRILVQIPGLDAAQIEEAKEQLRKVAKLEFRLRRTIRSFRPSKPGRLRFLQAIALRTRRSAAKAGRQRLSCW